MEEEQSTTNVEQAEHVNVSTEAKINIIPKQKEEEEKILTIEVIKENSATGPKGIDWVEAKAYYCEDVSRSYVSVATKFGVSVKAVENKGSEEKWVKFRQELGEKAMKAFEENKIAEIANANNKHLMSYQRLEKIANLKIANMINDKGDAKAMLKLKPGELKSITDVLEKSINGQRLILGLPTSVSKNELSGRLETGNALPKETIEKMDNFFKLESEK